MMKGSQELISAYHKIEYNLLEKATNFEMFLQGYFLAHSEISEIPTQMSRSEVIRILETHNKWRRGQDPYGDGWKGGMPVTPKEIGTAIDEAVKILKEI